MQNKTILIMDADDFERSCLAENLKLLGHQVYEAKDELEGLDVVLGLGFSSTLDYIIDFDYFFRGNVMDVLLKVAEEKFSSPPILISDNLKFAQQFEMQKKFFDESFPVSSTP